MNTHRIHICKNNNKISHFSPLVMGSQTITLLIEAIPRQRRITLPIAHSQSPKLTDICVIGKKVVTLSR